MLTPEQMNVIFHYIHSTIAEISEKTARRIPPDSSEILYPPNINLTVEEIVALNNLMLNESARSGLRKLISEACATVMFRFFELADGVADPPKWSSGTWIGFSFCKKSADDSKQMMFHDWFYESYRDFMENE